MVNEKEWSHGTNRVPWRVRSLTRLAHVGGFGGKTFGKALESTPVLPGMSKWGGKVGEFYFGTATGLIDEKTQIPGR